MAEGAEKATRKQTESDDSLTSTSGSTWTSVHL
jgi:hypothetical protein